MNIIEFSKVWHKYESYQKSHGLIGTVADFFHRKEEAVIALNNISFNIRCGEMVGLLGPNGAGKTTVMKILSGLIHPTEGEIDILGFQPYKKPVKLLKNIGLVLGQKSQLNWDLPAMETLQVIREIYDVKKADFSNRLKLFLEILEVEHRLDTPVRKLSLGERMKFELIASLIHYPAVLLLDEPTIGLDITSQKSIRNFLKKINEQLGTTIIITSHYMRDIEELANRLLILKKGLLCYDGSLSQLVKDHNKTKLIKIETKQNLENYTKYSIRKISENTWELECAIDSLNEVMAALAAEIPLTNVNTEDKPFEEIIYKIFEEEHTNVAQGKSLLQNIL